jgi:hypothetical protein
MEWLRGRAEKRDEMPMSNGYDILRVRPFRAFRDVEIDLLAGPEFKKAMSGDVREVGKYVGSAIHLLDETEAFCRIEPLHSASSHFLIPPEEVSRGPRVMGPPEMRQELIRNKVPDEVSTVARGGRPLVYE